MGPTIRKIFRNASKEFDSLVECDHLCLFKETPVNVSKKATRVILSCLQLKLCFMGELHWFAEVLSRLSKSVNT